MIEVIKRNAYKYEYTCQNCGSVMRLDKSDIKYRSGGYNETWWEFTCPVCNKTETDDDSLDHFISDKFKVIPIAIDFSEEFKKRIGSMRDNFLGD